MCGIVGIIGRPRRGAMPLFESLLVAAEVRGTDATGFAAVVGGTVLNDSAALPARDFIRTSERFATFLESTGDYAAVIGHTRLATSGVPWILANNHPHCSHDRTLALVHNGIISGYTGSRDIETISDCDSEWIIRVIEAGETVEAGIQEHARTTPGDFACALLSNQGTVWIWRNDGRPLVIADFRRRFGVWAFASTGEIIRTALKQMGKRVGKPGIRSVKPGNIYRIDPDQWRGGFRNAGTFDLLDDGQTLYPFIF